MGFLLTAALVSQVIAFEASGEPFEGQVLVAKVIQNRSVERNITYEEVVKQKYQFSCVKNGYIDKNLKPRTKEELKIAEKAWEAAKLVSSPANLYCRYDCWPPWRKSHKVKELFRVGNHVFFYEKR